MRTGFAGEIFGVGFFGIEVQRQFGAGESVETGVAGFQFGVVLA